MRPLPTMMDLEISLLTKKFIYVVLIGGMGHSLDIPLPLWPYRDHIVQSMAV